MHFKAGRQNHNFQIIHFLIGSCSTADAAYGLLADQYEDRNNAIKMYEGAKLRTEAKKERAEQRISDFKASNSVRGRADALEAQADLEDIKAMAETEARNYEAAVQERDFIKECMDKLQAHRKYSDLPLAEALQAVQREEWRGELVRRAENFIFTGGMIPADHFDTMRMHPDFERTIMPHVSNLQQLAREGRHQDLLVYVQKSETRVDLGQVLGLTYEPGPETARIGSTALGNGANGTRAVDFRQRSA